MKRMCLALAIATVATSLFSQPALARHRICPPPVKAHQLDGDDDGAVVVRHRRHARGSASFSGGMATLPPPPPRNAYADAPHDLPPMRVIYVVAPPPPPPPPPPEIVYVLEDVPHPIFVSTGSGSNVFQAPPPLMMHESGRSGRVMVAGHGHDRKFSYGYGRSHGTNFGQMHNGSYRSGNWSGHARRSGSKHR